MKTIIKPILYVAIIGLICLAAYATVIYPRSSVTVSKGQINKVKTMVELCTIDFYNEIPVKDTIADWELFGVQKQRGSISFDIENLKIDAEEDTVRIILPPEKIEIMESTDENAWVPLDSKDLRAFRFKDAPAEIWNEVKKNIMRRSIESLYDNGTVERARAEGVETLQTFMEKLYRKPVKVEDPTPKGSQLETICLVLKKVDS